MSSDKYIGSKRSYARSWVRKLSTIRKRDTHCVATVAKTLKAKEVDTETCKNYRHIDS